MKTRLLVLAITTLLPMLCAATDTNGFLVIEIGRYVYGTSNGKATDPEIKQSFKIPLTPEFLSNFKNPPSDNSTGSGFCCTSQFEKHQETGFMWWLARTSDHRWHVHMWSRSRNPSVTQTVTIKNLEDLEMSYQDSYVNGPDGVNVSFSAKYESAEEMQREGPMLTPSVKRDDQSYLFQGDSLTNCPVVLRGSFQH